MNKLKKTEGFTLVELIVVIAILGILAAVAVPAYSGYLDKAKEASDYTQLDAIKTAAIFAYTEAHIENPTVTNIYVSEKTTSGSNTVNGAVYVNIAGTAPTDAEKTANVINISAYYPGIADFTFESGATSALWTAATAKWELN